MRNWKELLPLIFALLSIVVLSSSNLKLKTAQWRRLRCQDNLQSLHRGALVYQEEHGGLFQPVIVRSKPRWTYWYSFVLPYIDDPVVFYCPAHSRAEKMLEKDPGQSDLLPSLFDPHSLTYGMNYALSSSGDEKKASPPGNIRNIADPAYTIYFGDCKMPNPSLRPTKWCWKDDYAPVHEDKANFVFIDGHVEAMNEDNLGLMHAFDEWKKDEKRWRNWKK